MKSQMTMNTIIILEDTLSREVLMIFKVITMITRITRITKMIASNLHQIISRISPNAKCLVCDKTYRIFRVSLSVKIYLFILKINWKGYILI